MTFEFDSAAAATARFRLAVAHVFDAAFLPIIELAARSPAVPPPPSPSWGISPVTASPIWTWTPKTSVGSTDKSYILDAGRDLFLGRC